jgi:hypothetical protein
LKVASGDDAIGREEEETETEGQGLAGLQRAASLSVEEITKV